MKKFNIWHRLLTGCAVAAIMYLFFVQARFVMQPIPIVFDSTEIAYGYSSVAFSGTVYHDEGIDAVSAGSGVSIHINGSTGATTTTDANGLYSFTGLTISDLDVITVFIDNEGGDGVLVVKVDDNEVRDLAVTGMDIYKDRLILRTSTGVSLELTTTNLDLANNEYDKDVDAVYNVPTGSRKIQVGNNKELFVWSTTTHRSSGSIFTHDLDVRGTLIAPSSGNIVASGSIDIAGTLVLSGSVTLTSVASGEILNIRTSTINSLYIDNGLEAYFRMDEGTGTNASGSTLNSASGGSLTNGPTWVTTNTGTTAFYNPWAIEFDGTNDLITFNDSWDLSTSMQRTFTTWFRRKSSTTEDVIFAKKTASGASDAGYILYIDDATDKLNFELADGSNTYTVTSNTAITDQNWHHVGVSFNALDNNGTNIFLDGVIDVSSKSGSLDPSSDSTANAIGFSIGSDTGVKGPFIGSIDDFRIYNRTLSGSEIVVLNAGEKATGSGTYYMKSTININGDLGIYAGTLDFGTGNSLNVTGDFSIYGELRTNSGTVILDGTTQTIRGSTAFNQISKTVTTSTTLTFETNTEQTVSGAITLQGGTNQRLKLRATVSGDQAFLIVEDAGATILNNLDIKDNNALTGALMSCTSGCVDSLNNINWEFLGECLDGVINTGEQCDDGNTNNADSCPNDCQLSVCGDGVVEGLEGCDPPNTGSCQSNCQFRGAGSGGGGGRSSAASTTSYFKRPEPPDGCGNSIFEPEKGEECDRGKRYNGLGTCSYDCKKLFCGDGTISRQNGEDCEPTPAGTRNGVMLFEVATCGETCTAPTTTPEGTIWGGCQRMLFPECGSEGPLLPSTPRESRCGNGVVDAGEECDFGGLCDGGQFDGSFWTHRTSVTACEGGGGITTPKSGDGCSETCKTEFCGDGKAQQRGADNQPNTADDEECDNGSVCSNDATKTCRLNSECGGENTCEYHGAKDRKCSDTCKKSASGSQPRPSAQSAPKIICGDKKVQGEEECDLGSENGKEESMCTSTCSIRVVDRPDGSTQPFCGNAVLDADEECDNGDENSDMLPNACRTNCVTAVCGDFVIDNNEECDNGDGNSDMFSDTCRLNCRLPFCGDGVLDSNEECDSSLSCNPNCTLALRQTRCGNGIKERGEQCDDGNSISGDGCSRFCQKEQEIAKESICGNGTTEEGEQCDDGNQEDGDGCSATCRVIELTTRKTAAALLKLDADVIVVNPTEIANALKFIDGKDPCSTLVIKGKNQKAALIRTAALEQKIPIVRNIALAKEIYKSVRSGEVIHGELCTQVNKIKDLRKGVKKPATPVVPQTPPIPEPAPRPLPQAPTQFAYGYYPYAQVTPLISQQPPAGDTGPAVVGIIVAGAAGGMSWIRRRRNKLK
jgi:cysteine-rich repeat protein